MTTTQKLYLNLDRLNDIAVDCDTADFARREVLIYCEENGVDHSLFIICDDDMKHCFNIDEPVTLQISSWFIEVKDSDLR